MTTRWTAPDHAWTLALCAVAFALVGCMNVSVFTGGEQQRTAAGAGTDICYSWDIPRSQADCHEDTIFTDSAPENWNLDGGTGIVDRDDGTGIVDRDDNFVTSFCLRPCAGGIYEGPAIVNWHNEHRFVEAYRHCPEEEH